MWIGLVEFDLSLCGWVLHDCAPEPSDSEKIFLFKAGAAFLQPHLQLPSQLSAVGGRP